uniref:Uncharacterized protein n=1 Tax=Salmo trutta TaxID=8032 RepID=A0A674DL60_SALTR
MAAWTDRSSRSQPLTMCLWSPLSHHLHNSQRAQPPVSCPVLTVAAQEILALLKPTSSKTVSPPRSSSTAESGTEMLEVPHLQVESDEAREARLDRQWKVLKVDLAELPDVYAKLAKIKLTDFIFASPPLFFGQSFKK